MKHQIDYDNHLLVIENEGKFRLFEYQCSKEQTVLFPAPFLSEPQDYMRIYSKQNLLVAKDSIYTLQGKVLIESLFTKAEIADLGDSCLIITTHNDTLDSVILWNGYKILWQSNPQKIVRNDKYAAVFECGSWSVIDANGKIPCPGLTITTEHIKIIGNFLIVDSAIGCHDVYSLKERKYIFHNQQIVKISRTENFILSVNLKQEATVYYNKEINKLQNVAYVELIDEANLFYVQYSQNNNYTVYQYNANLIPFAKDAEIVSYDKQHKHLLIYDAEGLKRFAVSNYISDGNSFCFLNRIY